MRGDRGGENMEVAVWMIQHRGANRASFMWGRYVTIEQTVISSGINSMASSTRNVRIERMWVEVGTQFCIFWRVFFTRLERRHGLDPSKPEHLWLLHMLFLDDINTDCRNFQREWNKHPVSGAGHNMTPNVSARRLVSSGSLISTYIIRTCASCLPFSKATFPPQITTTSILPYFHNTTAQTVDEDGRNRDRRERAIMITMDPPYLRTGSAVQPETQKGQTRRRPTRMQPRRMKTKKWIAKLPRTNNDMSDTHLSPYLAAHLPSQKRRKSYLFNAFTGCVRRSEFPCISGLAPQNGLAVYMATWKP